MDRPVYDIVYGDPIICHKLITVRVNYRLYGLGREQIHLEFTHIMWVIPCTQC